MTKVKYPKPHLKFNRRRLATILEIGLRRYAHDRMYTTLNARYYMCNALRVCCNRYEISRGDLTFAIQHIRDLIDPHSTLSTFLEEIMLPNTYDNRVKIYKDWIKELRK
jgi:hypothetical protein